MRIPFTKTAPPHADAATAAPASPFLKANGSSSDPHENRTSSNGNGAETPAPELPLMDAPLSPKTQNSALHLVTSIREILVGDQIRGIDDRFVYLRDTLQSHFSQLIANLSSEAKADREKTRSEIENVSEKVDAKAGELERQDAKTAEAVKIASMRLNSIDDEVGNAVTELRAEDTRIGAELNSALDRISSLETQLTTKCNEFEKTHAKAGEEILRSMARIDDLDRTCKETAHSLREQESRFNEKIQIAIMRIGSLEENLVKHVEEMRQQEIAIQSDRDARILRVEEGTEAFRCAFNDKMSELCNYVSSQVTEFSALMSQQKAELKNEIAEHHKPAINPVFAAASSPAATPSFPKAPMAATR